MRGIVRRRFAPDNGEASRRTVAAARIALERAMTFAVAADASFADRERAVLAAANEACRLMLETALQATADAQADRVRVEGVVYERHQEGTVSHSLWSP